jgi:hypothetical protein
MTNLSAEKIDTLLGRCLVNDLETSVSRAYAHAYSAGTDPAAVEALETLLAMLVASVLVRPSGNYSVAERTEAFGTMLSVLVNDVLAQVNTGPVSNVHQLQLPRTKRIFSGDK